MKKKRIIKLPTTCFHEFFNGVLKLILCYFFIVPVSFQPVIHITSNEYENRENQQSARVVNFVKGNVKIETNNLNQ